MSAKDDQAVKEVLPSPNSEFQALSAGTVLRAEKESFIQDTTPKNIPGLDIDTAPGNDNVPAQPAKKSYPEHYVLFNEETSVLYEKEGTWELERVIPYTFKSKKDKDNAGVLGLTESQINNLPPRKKCCLDKDPKPLSLTQNIKAIYDVLSGKESYPCNECDRPLCQESLWHWLSSIVIDVVDTVKTITKKPDTATSCCGTMDSDTLRSNTKGTHAEFDLPPPNPMTPEVKAEPETVKTVDPVADDAVVDKPDDLNKTIIADNPDSPSTTIELIDVLEPEGWGPHP